MLSSALFANHAYLQARRNRFFALIVGVFPWSWTWCVAPLAPRSAPPPALEPGRATRLRVRTGIAALDFASGSNRVSSVSVTRSLGVLLHG